MADIQRMRVALTGLSGLPGVSTFYATTAADLQAPVRAWYDSLKAYFPAGLAVQVEGAGDVVEDSTGVLTGSWINTAPAVVTATGSGAYSAAAGACVNWLTSTITDGRRIRGRTFLVPLTPSAYQSDGTLATVFLSTLTTSCATLQAAVGINFLVWHRPREARAADGSRPAISYRAGSSAAVAASSFGDKTAVLRSRRD